MISPTKLDRFSSLFFMIGAFLAQSRLLPLGPINAIVYAVALISNFTAYIIWLAASRLYPNEPALKKHWYGFAKYKNQHMTAALLGLLSIISGALTFIFPFMLIPAAWLFVLSDLVWLTGEYHKIRNPKTSDKDCDSSHSQAYLSYVITMTVIATIVALATSLSFFIPMLAPLFAIFSTLICTTLGCYALDRLIYFSTKKSENEKIILKDNDKELILNSNLTPREEISPPTYYQSPYKQPQYNTAVILSSEPQSHNSSFTP